MGAKAEIRVTQSVEETEELGARLAIELSKTPGVIVGLVGELGAGKTSFVKGMSRGLGVKGYVKSPSFTLLNIYEGGVLPLFHIDLYRLGAHDEFHGAGLEEYIYAKGISVIEWADKFPEIYAQCNVIVAFSYKGEGKRKIEIRQQHKEVF